jgi:hypothetical protein
VEGLADRAAGLGHATSEVTDMLHARRSFFQAAWVVNDLYTAMNRGIDNASVGPLFVFPGTRFHKALWYGRPVDVTVDIALAQVGSMQIELIKRRSAGALVYPKTVLAPPRGITLPLSPMICIQSALRQWVSVTQPVVGSLPLSFGAARSERDTICQPHTR